MQWRNNFKLDQSVHNERCIVDLVIALYMWERPRAINWVETSHHAFGGASPRYLIQMGRTHKVKEFIEAASKLTESQLTKREEQLYGR
jgi:hypothetical protein